MITEEGRRCPGAVSLFAVHSWKEKMKLTLKRVRQLCAAFGLPAIVIIPLFYINAGSPQSVPGAFVLSLLVIAAIGIPVSMKLGRSDRSGSQHCIPPGRGGDSPDESANERNIRERAAGKKAPGVGAMSADQLAFARAVAAAAGYVEGSEGMSPDLVYVIRQQLMRLSSGSPAIVSELLQVFRTRGGDWDQLCLFRRDPERIGVFFGVLAEIITGDALVSDEERGRFSEVAAHFGYSADEAMSMLHDSGRFRRFWSLGDRWTQSGSMSYDDALWILGVSPLSSISEIRQAYMRLAERYQPDKVRDRGFSEDVVSIYRKKSEIISGAWNAVMASRGI